MEAGGRPSRPCPRPASPDWDPPLRFQRASRSHPAPPVSTLQKLGVGSARAPSATFPGCPPFGTWPGLVLVGASAPVTLPWGKRKLHRPADKDREAERSSRGSFSRTPLPKPVRFTDNLAGGAKKRTFLAGGTRWGGRKTRRNREELQQPPPPRQTEQQEAHGGKTPNSGTWADQPQSEREGDGGLLGRRLEACRTPPLSPGPAREGKVYGQPRFFPGPAGRPWQFLVPAATLSWAPPLQTLRHGRPPPADRQTASSPALPLRRSDQPLARLGRRQSPPRPSLWEAVPGGASPGHRRSPTGGQMSSISRSRPLFSLGSSFSWGAFLP